MKVRRAKRTRVEASDEEPTPPAKAALPGEPKKKCPKINGNGRAGYQTSPQQKARRILMERKVYDLCAQGYSFRAIAEKLKLDRATVNLLFANAHSDYLGDQPLFIQQRVAMVTAKIDGIYRAWYEKATDEVEPCAKATAIIHRNIDREIRLWKPAQHLHAHFNSQVPADGEIKTAAVNEMDAARLIREAFPKVQRDKMLEITRAREASEDDLVIKKASLVEMKTPAANDKDKDADADHG